MKEYIPQEITKTLLKPFLLYFFTLPFIIGVLVALFVTNIHAFLYNTFAMLLYFGVLYLSNKGFLQEYEYEQKIFTKAPKIPYKLLAALLLGVVVFYSSFFLAHKTLLNAAFIATIAFIGYLLYYGVDPKIDKLNNLGDISEQFVLETLADADEKLTYITSKLPYIQRYSLKIKIENAIATSHEILHAIQEDPQDIRIARKFLMVYLDGIKDVISAYTELKTNDIDDTTHQKVEALFDDVQTRFDKELTQLKQNNLFDLNVNIDTLKQQINT